VLLPTSNVSEHPANAVLAKEYGMPRLETLSEINRQAMLSFPCLEPDMTPWSPLRQSLSQSKISLADILQSHVSIGFDHTAIMRDLNVTLPIDRVRELVDKGIVGSLAENYYSFMGALRNPKPLIEATGPEVASRLKDEGVGLVLITPT
jgi:D-proline reductase (dithiol) PrdB